MQVELIKQPDVVTSDSLKQYLADISAVVRNAQPKDNDRLFDRLIKESYGNKASRVFEFIPCRIHHELPKRAIEECKTVQVFGFFKGNGYYTNARELLNWGWTWDEVIKTVDFTHYKSVKCVTPYFVYGQVSTHTQITSVSHSARYTESDLGYWFPDEYRVYMFDEYSDMTIENCQEIWNDNIRCANPLQLQAFMKDTLGITRREIYARGNDMLQYRVFSLGGYTNNPNAWEHFINQRLHDAHTQKETRELTALIAHKIKVTYGNNNGTHN